MKARRIIVLICGAALIGALAAPVGAQEFPELLLGQEDLALAEAVKTPQRRQLAGNRPPAEPGPVEVPQKPPDFVTSDLFQNARYLSIFPGSFPNG